MDNPTRLEQLAAKANHPMMGKLYRKLTAKDLAACRQFICDHDHLDKVDFEMAANRWFMDHAEPPKHWTIMTELVSSSNGCVVRKTRE